MPSCQLCCCCCCCCWHQWIFIAASGWLALTVTAYAGTRRLVRRQRLCFCCSGGELQLFGVPEHVCSMMGAEQASCAWQDYLEGPANAQLQAIAASAQHRLRRGVWTSPGAGGAQLGPFAAAVLML